MTTKVQNYLGAKIIWGQAVDPNYLFEADFNGEKLLIRLNDFPDENLYTLIVNNVEVTNFDDWPEQWTRSRSQQLKVEHSLVEEIPENSSEDDEQRNRPIEVFISYSYKDEGMKEELVKHLSLLQRQGLITSWHDRKILPGEEWSGEIDTHLNEATVILLLISADFLASDYCWGNEMNRAIERHKLGEARVIPIILRPVSWQGAPFGKLQALPKDTNPITTWQNEEKAFTNVVNGIREIVEKSA